MDMDYGVRIDFWSSGRAGRGVQRGKNGNNYNRVTIKFFLNKIKIEEYPGWN